MEEQGTPQPPEQPEAGSAHPQHADPGLAYPPAVRGEQTPNPGRVDTWSAPPTQQWQQEQHWQQQQQYAVPPPQSPPHPQGPPELSKPTPWQRIRARGWRLAIGVGIAGAALLLIPFFLFPTLDPDRPVDQWWPPFAIGLGTLVLLSVLRLDRLLRGWTWHVAGVVFVGALVVSTSANPWAWAFALSLGLLLVGLLRLPRPEIAIAGAVMCAVSIIGFSVRATQITQQQAQGEANAHVQNEQQLRGVLDGAQRVLPTIETAVAESDPAGLCRSATLQAQQQLEAATGTTSCDAAVIAAHARWLGAGAPPPRIPDASDPTLLSDPSYVLDGCARPWATAAGPQLGKVQVERQGPNNRYVITAFVPC